MASGRKDIYRNHSSARVVFTVIGCVLAAAVLLFVILFFSLRRYAVYTPDGVRMDLPWREETSAGDSGALPESPFSAYAQI